MRPGIGPGILRLVNRVSRTVLAASRYLSISRVGSTTAHVLSAPTRYELWAMPGMKNCWTNIGCLPDDEEITTPRA
jgi:hypothetical protein